MLTVGVALAGVVVGHTHVKDPVVHVRVWWTVETTKSPSMHQKCQSLHHVEFGHYTKGELQEGN